MHTFINSILTMLFFSSVAVSGDGMINIESAYNVATTADRLERVLEKKGMTLFAHIDHSKGAEKAGLKLRPMITVIFGNPKVGTPLMQCNQTIAIDLPQKALIWEDEKGQVWFSYNDPKYLAQRHGLKGCDEIIKKIEKALANFAKATTEK
jgi:uncharacterized protein (DUF302 family)